jgi:hypothetical protein
LLALLVDFAEPLEPTFAAPLELTFVLALPASTAARRVSALSVSAASRALCAARRWLARRFISFALCAPHILPSMRLEARRLFYCTLDAGRSSLNHFD